jgi:hypothetical protein
MQLTRIVQALTADLSAVTELGDERTAEAGRRIAHSLQASVGLRLLDALGEAARELSTQLPNGRVEVRLVGQDPELVFVPEEPEDHAPPVGGEEGFTARISLRLPETLKRGVEKAAEREGMSVNSWLVRAISGAVHGPAQRSGKRLTGFAQS